MSDEKSDEGNENSMYKELGKFVVETLVISAIIIGIPFLISGVWPPFVSVISDSMEPNMTRGDMVFIVENDRFTEKDSIDGVSVQSQEDRKGDVIVYYPNGNEGQTPVIHRAVMHVEEGENWVERANETYLSSDSCTFADNCPAPNAGFITLGDANSRYDQSAGLSDPVRSEWIVGKSQAKIPFLGWIRVGLSG